MNSSDEAVEALTRLIADHPMWIADNGRALDYLPEREAKISDFLDEARSIFAAFAAAVRAEAVADERRRIEQLRDDIKVDAADDRRLGLMDSSAYDDQVDGIERVLELLAAGSVPVATPEPTLVACPCWKCDEERRTAKYALDGDQMAYLSRFMIVCPECGNKRCPKATSHEFECTGSNESGQRGSRYGRVATPPAEPAAQIHDANCEQQLGACCCHCQKRADVAFSHAAPSQPVTCEHDWADGPHGYTTTQDIDRGVPSRWCPGPVSVPKESSE